jgi:hypothetical protein
VGGNVNEQLAVERRARRLIAWYPKPWRARYGDEFCELLVQEFEERPRSIARALDIAWNGVVSRVEYTGIAGLSNSWEVQARACLAWWIGSLSMFLAAALAVWSQLMVGWQWTSPRTPDTTSGVVVMSVAVVVLAALAVIGIVPVLATVAMRLARGHGRRLRIPSAMATVSAVTLLIGAHSFENGWPGTGGHHWALQGMVPGGVNAFVWAATLAITSYWAHPGALRAFPAAEVAWMAVSPLAIVSLSISGAVTIRRLDLSVRAARFVLRIGRLALLAMFGFFLGALAWLFDCAQRPRSIPSNLFHVGTIDVLGACVMGIALLLALQAVSRGIDAVGHRVA